MLSLPQSRSTACGSLSATLVDAYIELPTVLPDRHGTYRAIELVVCQWPPHTCYLLEGRQVPLALRVNVAAVAVTANDERLPDYIAAAAVTEVNKALLDADHLPARPTSLSAASWPSFCSLSPPTSC